MIAALAPETLGVRVDDSPEAGRARALAEAAAREFSSCGHALYLGTDVQTQLAIVLSMYAAIDRVEETSLRVLELERECIEQDGLRTGHDVAPALRRVAEAVVRTKRASRQERERTRATEGALRERIARVIFSR